MKIVICGSRKFYKEIGKAGDELREAGHIVFEPLLNRNRAIDDLPADLKKYAFMGLTYRHFELIRKSEVCLIFNKEGYIGNSVTMELGFAVACGLPIYAIEEDQEEQCRNALFDFVVGDVDEFVKMMNAGERDLD